MESINIFDPCELGKMNDLIHDCYFDVDSIKIKNNVFEVSIFQNKAETLTRCFLIFKQFEIQSYTSVLRIYNVNFCKIVDSEKIGYYSFNELIFDPVRNLFSVATNEPISIILNIGSFKVSLTSCKDNVQCKQHWYIWKPMGLFAQSPKE